MLKKKKTEVKEGKDLSLLEEWLPKLDKGKLAYLKGAARALFYAQKANPTISNKGAAKNRR